MRYWLSISLMLGLRVVAQQIVIDNVSYANQEIKFYRHSDPLTNQKELLSKGVASDSGKLVLDIDLDETQKIFTYIGKYQAYIYVEPKQKYELVVPPFQERTFRAFLNPYFKFDQIHLGAKDLPHDDINKLIVQFNNAFYPIYNKYMSVSVSTKDFSGVEKDIQKLDSFLVEKDPYFQDYVHYKKGELAYLARPHAPTDIAEDYFTGKTVAYRNSSFNELFLTIFKGYLFKYGDKETRKQTFKSLSQSKNLDSLLLAMLSDPALETEAMREWVLISFLYQELFGSNFSRELILEMIDKLSKHTSIDFHRQVIERIIIKSKYLNVGELAPNLILKNVEGTEVSLEDLRGQYVFLNFATSKSYTCLQEFEVMRYLYDKHKSRLEFVTIFVEEKEEDMQLTLQKLQAEWTGLFFTKETLEAYDIKAFPTNFLIAPDGILILSPAPSITNDFERQFFEIMRSRGDI